MANIKWVKCSCGVLHSDKRENGKCGVCNHKQDMAEVTKSPYFEPEVYRPKPRKVLLTDEQQYAINKAIDSRHNMPLACRQINPGDPDFDAIAAQCTDPLDIPNERPIEYLGGRFL